MKRYVLGFLFHEGDEVLLIRKNRPDWQAGFLNGLGGKIEANEFSAAAMVREMEEESGIKTNYKDWEYVCTMKGDDWDVVVYANILVDSRPEPEQRTDEYVAWYPRDPVDAMTIDNLKWLIPLAWDVLGGNLKYRIWRGV